MRNKVRLLWQIYPPYMLVVLVSLLTFAWYGTRIIQRLYLDKTARDLEARCQLLNHLLYDVDMLAEQTRADSLIKALGQEIETRITIILPSGLVTCDSDKDPHLMDNHASRPEIIQAYQGKTGQSMRYSATLHREMMYVAIQSNARPGYVIRTAITLNQLSETLEVINQKIIWVFFLLILFASLINYVLSQRIQRPIHTLVQGFKTIGKGDLDYRVTISGSQEFETLSHSMNNMAAELQERLQTITRQRNELQAVLSGMAESVLVVNTDLQIIRFNEAARHEFNLPDEEEISIPVSTTFHEDALQEFIIKTLNSIKPLEEEIMIRQEPVRVLQAYGCLLKDANYAIIGALIVLDDVTRLKILENIRKDFVANVSHELKTPITSIKGYVETLREGAIDDADNAQRFLKIISKHADRLNSIIEDLLNLSRIEQESGTQQIALENGSIENVLQEAKSLCLAKASEKDIFIAVDADEALKGRINAPLLEQSIMNLIDNAIKYSPAHSTVQVQAYQKNKRIIIQVKDNGCGIPQTHLPRLFERFYRVDKARSRELGGTGLGLAIVKHIVQAHEGTIAVESKLHEGSTFSISLPCA